MNQTMRHSLLILSVVAGALSDSTPAFSADIPKRPEEITFAPLKFEPPDAAQYRHTLSNGVVVYLAPDHEFPLINVAFVFKGGAYLDPAEKPGLADATGDMIRRGGTATVTAQDFDEQADFLAAQITANCGATSSGASLNCLKSNFDDSFKLFMVMIRNPGFQQDRFEVYKSEQIEDMKQRNDNADPILSREWDALMFGRDHFEAAEATKQSIESISIDDMKAFHQRLFRATPGNMYIAVTGDFEPKDMLARIEAAFQGWTAGEAFSDPPAPKATFAPGVYHVQKDIPQGKVQIGKRSITRDDPDAIALMVMNNILGGGGFSSRIMSRVRSDEGLAYDAGSGLSPRVFYPGTFEAGFQSKNATCALAIKIIMEEINRIRTDLVTAEELDIAKKSYIETFPRTFESKPRMLGVFIDDEMTNRPKDYWKGFRDRVNAVTPEQIQAAAQKYLDPQMMAIVIVGDWESIAQGDVTGRASMKDFFGGNVMHLPLRDPLTLEVLK